MLGQSATASLRALYSKKTTIADESEVGSLAATISTGACVTDEEYDDVECTALLVAARNEDAVMSIQSRTVQHYLQEEKQHDKGGTLYPLTFFSDPKVIANEERIQEQIRILQELDIYNESNEIVEHNHISVPSQKETAHNLTMFSDEAILNEQNRLLEEIDTSNGKSRSIPTTVTLSGEFRNLQTEEFFMDSNDDIIQEQIQILKEIEQANIKKSPNQLPASLSQTQTASLPEISQRSLRDTTTTATSSDTNNNTNDDHYHDTIVALSNGAKVRIKGTKHIYRNILQGKDTILTQCATCETVSQVAIRNHEMKPQIFYCTICKQVGPIQALSSGHNDSDVALALQHQEVEASYQRKLLLTKGMMSP